MRLHGVTQVELARRTGYSTKHVNQVLQGRVRLSIALAEEFAEAIGCLFVAWFVINPDGPGGGTTTQEGRPAHAQDR